MTDIEARLPLSLVGLDTDNAHVERKNGKKTRVYNKLRTPYQRVLDSVIMTAGKAAELTRKIISIQIRLSTLAKSKTDTLTAEISRAKIRAKIR